MTVEAGRQHRGRPAVLPSLLRRPWLSLALCALVVAGASSGCAAPIHSGRAPLQHIVLIKLHDASLAAALADDTRRHLSAVPAVAELWVGQPFELGRRGVDLDWDVGLIVGFKDREAYEAYLEHPEHSALVEAWQPRWEWIRVHDLGAVPVGVPATLPGSGV